MREALHVLFGAGFTAALCVAAGSLALRGLRVKMERGEEWLFAFVGGSALVSTAVFFLCVVHQARKGVFLWGGAGLIVAAAVARPPFGRSRPRLPAATAMFAVFVVVFTTFFFLYFFNALAPERSPDGAGYHLGNVMRMSEQHGFAWNYHSMYSYLSQGMEMLFLVAFSFGGHSAAAMTHFAFLVALPLMIAVYGRRFGIPHAGFFAAAAVFASPVVGMDGISAYNDLTVATVLFAEFFLLQVWDETRESKLLILIGLVGGFAYGVKYTAGLALPFVVAFVWWRSRRFRDVGVI
ncbi:MAG TPA: glycosyltransferase family 39 protein, partial [Bryobacteraceae bacterium]